MNKDALLSAIRDHLEARRIASLTAVPSLAEVTVRPQKSAELLPESGSLILVTADDLEHTLGPLHRLEPLRLRVQTAGLTGRDVAAHRAAMDLCVAAFPHVESEEHPAAFAAFSAALAAAGASARFWYVQGQREHPVEDNAWWEDQLVVRVGVAAA